VSSADYIVLSCYLVGIFAVSVIVGTRNKSAVEMFAAGGQSPWWTSGLSGFMTMFSAGTFVVWGGIAYKHGLVAVAINLCYGIAALLVGYFVAGRWKELGVRTPAEFIEIRFGRAALHFYTWSMLAFRLVSVAVALYSLGVLMVAMMPLSEGNPLRDPATGNLSVAWAILFFGGMVVIYTMIGGLWGVLLTDVLQFIVLNLAVLFVVPLALAQVGGVGQFVEAAPKGFFLPTGGGYTWFFLAAWIAIHYFVVGAEWAFVQRFICVPTSTDARKSSYLFGALYLVSPLLWLLPPMIYRVQNPIPSGATANQINDLAEQAYIQVCHSVLPSGMVGLMTAAMFSATASMISSQLNVFAGVLTSDIYRPLAGANEGGRQLVWAGRIFTVLLGAVLISLAVAIPVLGGAEKVIVAITSLMVVPLLAPVLLGLFSRRLGTRTVWMAAGVGAALALPWLALKLACDEAGWLAESKTWSDQVTWVRGNLLVHARSIELLIGVVVPAVLVGVLHHTTRATDAGWTRVSQVAVARAEEPVLQSSRMPALIVGWSLAASGMMMGILAISDTENRSILGAFAAVLWVLAAAILGFSSRLAKLQESEKAYADT